MANFPNVIETIASEANADVFNVGGTVLDAVQQNKVYALLLALETWVGPNTDTPLSTSHEGRLQAIEAAVAALQATITDLPIDYATPFFIGGD